MIHQKMTSVVPQSNVSKQTQYSDPSGANESSDTGVHPPVASSDSTIIGSNGTSEVHDAHFENMDLQWSEFTNLQEIQHLDDMIHNQHLNTHDGSYYNDPSQRHQEYSSSFHSSNKPKDSDMDQQQYYQEPAQIFHHDFSEDHQSHSDMAPTTAVRPNDVFTPLVSPAVTPLEHSTNPPYGTGFHQPGMSNVSEVGMPKKVGFSPLTSPALEFQGGRFMSQSNNAASLRQKRRDNQTPNKSSPSTSEEDQRRASYKRSKTPNGTPLFGPTNPSSLQQQHTGSSSRIKQSPLAKPSSPVVSGTRRSYKTKPKPGMPGQSGFDMLPESATSNDLMLPPSRPPIKEEDHSGMDSRKHSYSQEHDPLNNENLPAATPATMMSFSLSKMPPKNSPRMLPKDNVLKNPNHDAKSAQSSPVILPSSNSFLLHEHQQLPSAIIPPLHINGHSKSSSRSSSLKTSPVIQNTDESQPSHSPDGFNVGKARSNSVSSNKSGQTDRKMTHKLAEQGRRNRMNIAIQDLEKFIPESLKSEVTVPSKATTVELSSRYIQMLREENRGLYQEVMYLKQELERLKGGSDSQDSISPFRVDEH
ncbi:hypothetical protein OGAPHI_003704 [Ogataea philodendri]|uniref:BHLH domain-containing protein n=1 Tax=Ogataea philodendri TaxID=1378263 RepID=A0A9P8P4T2_9ASCO|nr:uncharacterized protein OGAPHI_003704 [Ogataea philodendri]KAH3665518.1 hypothetical protein OGAPHI_003704 [Ogataea philodendri]